MSPCKEGKEKLLQPELANASERRGAGTATTVPFLLSCDLRRARAPAILLGELPELGARMPPHRSRASHRTRWRALRAEALAASMATAAKSARRTSSQPSRPHEGFRTSSQCARGCARGAWRRSPAASPLPASSTPCSATGHRYQHEQNSTGAPWPVLRHRKLGNLRCRRRARAASPHLHPRHPGDATGHVFPRLRRSVEADFPSRSVRSA